MKILSVTRDDGRVVELTHDEYLEFSILADALEGKTQDELEWSFHDPRGDMRMSRDTDFSGVFGAIMAFYKAAFRLNEMKRLTNEFAEFMKVKKEN